MAFKKNISIIGAYILGVGILAYWAGVDPLFLFRNRGSYAIADKSEKSEDDNLESLRRNYILGKTNGNQQKMNKLQKSVADLRRKNLKSNSDLFGLKDYLWELRQYEDNKHKLENEIKYNEGLLENDRIVNDWWQRSNDADMKRMNTLTGENLNHQERMAELRTLDEIESYRKKSDEECNNYQKSIEVKNSTKNEKNAGKSGDGLFGWFGGMFGR